MVIKHEIPEMNLELYILQLKKRGIDTMDVEFRLDEIISSSVSMPLPEVQ